ncbi:MFS transporter [Saccharopolyspora hattusasensis]|uniref:MFS transporter n=1 Tax=Saccharopolyspora hattusasensis TaxID=1128679 RepID=UPI003D98304C
MAEPLHQELPLGGVLSLPSGLTSIEGVNHENGALSQEPPLSAADTQRTHRKELTMPSQQSNRADESSTGGVASNPSMSRRVVIGGFLGSVVEYYDFLIYGTAAALVFNKVFFPSSSATAGMLASLATFGVGYLARPIGAIIFGHIGDRAGRKSALTITLLLMGAATLLIGCLPTYSMIGAAAPAMLVLCRLLQGISAGGESVGASLLTMEHAPQRKRALYSSWMLNGVATGSILGTLAFIPISALPEEALVSWGWRIPFLASVITVFITYLVRRGIDESPEFAAKAAVRDHRDRLAARYPLITLLRSHLAPTILVFVSSLVTCVAPMILVFGLSYATTEHSLDRTSVLAAITISQIVALVFHPLFGALADRVGKKAVFVVGSLLCAGLIFAYLGSIGANSIIMVFVMTIVLKGVVYAAPNALWPSFFAEQFTPDVRYTGVALATQIGLILYGFTPTIAYALIGDGSAGWLPAALYMGGICVLAAVAATVSRTAKVGDELKATSPVSSTAAPRS